MLNELRKKINRPLPISPPSRGGDLREGESKNFGYSLLLAVILVSTIISGATAIARLIVLNLRQTRYLDQAIVASSAASSGVEKALFLLRKTEEEITDRQKPTTETIGNATAEWEATLAEEAVFKIPQNDYAVLNLPQNSRIDTIEIPPWTKAPDCPSWIEVSGLSWDPTSPQGFSEADVQRQPYALGDSPVRFDVLADKAVQIRIKALYCDIHKLEVYGLADGGPTSLPSRVVINSTGDYLGSRQALRISTLARPPLSGLFDFVIFSECSLVKGGVPACPP
jgi:hypothetical protein